MAYLTSPGTGAKTLMRWPLRLSPLEIWNYFRIMRARLLAHLDPPVGAHLAANPLDLMAPPEHCRRLPWYGLADRERFSSA